MSRSVTGALISMSGLTGLWGALSFFPLNYYE